MPLNTEMSAARFVVPGVVGGTASFVFSRLMIEPLIGAAVDYEEAREDAESHLAGGEHAHGHELFTRSVQENFGAAVGVIAIATAMGVLFAVAYTVIRPMLERRGISPDPTGLALALAAGMFAAIVLVPALKYPANPPTVGLEETIGARSSAFLTMTVISVVGACVTVAAALAWSRKWGGWRATALAVGGYSAVMLGAYLLLPSFHEVPGPISGPDGLVLDGFPAEVLGEFWVYSLVNQALMWLVIGATYAALAAVQGRAASVRERRFAETAA